AALWHVAAAEQIARRWDAAEANARRAVELAAARRDRETERLSRRLLGQVEARKPAPPPAAARTDREFLALVESLSARLAQWSPDRRSRSHVRAEWAA
ncbi:MAG TPA: hypothetical protein VFQ45_21510, partial [Longimicrobium sp.]|nr:hypothetical protein [Longimicrobium sp.]